MEIETGSANTADADRDVALASGDFFATDRWPKATYEASQFAATGPGRYEARGKLTIRGIARDVPVTFTFEPAADGRSAILSGARQRSAGSTSGSARANGRTRSGSDDVRVRSHPLRK